MYLCWFHYRQRLTPDLAANDSGPNLFWFLRSQGSHLLRLLERLEVHLGAFGRILGKWEADSLTVSNPEKIHVPYVQVSLRKNHRLCSRTWGWVVRAVSFYLLEEEAEKYLWTLKNHETMWILKSAHGICMNLSAILGDLVFHRVQLSISAFKQTLFLEISKMSSDMHDVF